MGLNLLADVGPGAFNVLRHLCHGRPVIENDAKGAAYYCLVINGIGKPETRAEVRAHIVGNLATRVYNHVIGQSAVAGDAGSMTANAAWRGDFLYDIGAVREIHIAGFNSALLANRGFLSVRRNKGVVIAQAKIEGQ